VCLSGCDAAPQTATTSAEAPSAPAAESSWLAQVLAVREGRSDSIRTDVEEITPSQLQQLGDGCESLTTLMIDTGVVGDDLAVLRHLPKLRQLKLPGAVDDNGIESIFRCRELELLNLPRGVFTDRSCEMLAQLDELMLLRFGSPNVSDAGIKAVARLSRLRFLHLLDVPISDAAIDDVASMKTLESFYLDGGQVSDEGLLRLIAKRPDLHVHLDQTHLPGDPNADD
jgi:hypothetical protein